MKRLFCVSVILFAIFAITIGHSQRKREKVEFDPEIKEQIDNREFKVIARTALPQGWKSVALNGNDYVRIDGDSLYSALPYYGRAYSAPYGGGEGLNFESEIEEYSVKDGKKGSVIIKFEARSRDDEHTYTLTIYPDCSAYIDVSSNDKQSISFMGEIYKKR